MQNGTQGMRIIFWFSYIVKPYIFEDFLYKKEVKI